ncbi:MAG TPA: diiron oxygenase [Acidimicrobiales bacterium]|nr:diiron oxygenase [Acidimicrobiales bacterium]
MAVLKARNESVSAEERIRRLNAASLRRVVEPDTEVPGAVGQVQVLPDDLLSVADLGLDLTAEQRATLAREELASIVRFGILFEAVLMSGFSYQLALSQDVTDPRFVYALHEIGEETRHSRLFVRLLEQLHPTQRNPFESRLAVRVRSRLLPSLLRRPATLDAFVLAGEEIPDLFQKLAAEHPDTDPFVRDVSRYHRMEEARHLAFARTTVGEHYRRATWSDRAAVRWVVPLGIVGMFDTMVQPFVYRTVGLPALKTWLAVRKQPRRVDLRHQCARAVLTALIDGNVLRRGRINRAWQAAAGVDRRGQPTAVA